MIPKLAPDALSKQLNAERPSTRDDTNRNVVLKQVLEGIAYTCLELNPSPLKG